FEVRAGTADVEVTLVDTPGSTVAIAGELHGFGLPTSQLSARSSFQADPEPTLRYEILQRGWLTDLSSNLAIRLPVDGFRRVVVRLQRGNVRIVDATRDKVTHNGRIALDVQTRSGVVQRP